MKSNGLEGTCSHDLLILVLHSSTEIADVEKIIKSKKNFSNFLRWKVELHMSCPTEIQ